jgi:negative regulator of flagellin synthesis FlgM
MTDAISNYNRIALNDARNRSTASRPESLDGRTESAQGGSAASSSLAASLGDQLQLSDVALQAMKTDSFDQAKVDAIKTAIQKGDYPLDARRIAESFYAIEQMIKG